MFSRAKPLSVPGAHKALKPSAKLVASSGDDPLGHVQRSRENNALQDPVFPSPSWTRKSDTAILSRMRLARDLSLEAGKTRRRASKVEFLLS